MINLNYIKYIAHILNTICIFTLGLTMYLMPNITTFLFSGETRSSTMILLLLLLLIATSLVPFFKGPIVINLLSGMSLLVLCLMVFYKAYYRIYWNFLTTEGNLNVAFFTIVKTASLETKINQYNVLLIDSLQSLSINNLQAAEYIMKLSHITNPNSSIILKYSLQDLSSLVNENVLKGINQYQESMAVKETSLTRWSWKKTMIVSLVAVIAIGGIIYYCYNATKLKDIISDRMKAQHHHMEINNQTRDTSRGSSVSIEELSKHAGDMNKSLCDLSKTVGEIQSSIINIRGDIATICTRSITNETALGNLFKTVRLLNKQVASKIALTDLSQQVQFNGTALSDLSDQVQFNESAVNDAILGIRATLQTIKVVCRFITRVAINDPENVHQLIMENELLRKYLIAVPLTFQTPPQ